MVNSEDWKERMTVAKKAGELGRTDLLEKLVNDKDSRVCCAVAEQDYGLDILVSDKNCVVREQVAYQAGELGREDLLERLVDDKKENVREQVARMGYKLEQLADDPNEDVREAVIKAAWKHGREDLLEQIAADWYSAWRNWNDSHTYPLAKEQLDELKKEKSEVEK